MPELNTIFNNSIKAILWPEFKRLGYKKSGNNFKCYDKAGWGRIVQFQKSQSNSAEELSFTVNTGLYLPEGSYAFPEDPGPKFTEPDCIVRQRLGRIKGSHYDEWYTLTPATDASLLFEQLARDFTQYLHSYLAAIQNRDDILDLLRVGQHGNTSVEIIRTLHLAGRQEVATQLLNTELLRTKYIPDRTALRLLAEELGVTLTL